ncbi:MAG: hypothetical protein KF819_02560 [Labilithrix sp.]|nr:hypothetical protein [Labilithrix sp.]
MRLSIVGLVGVMGIFGVFGAGCSSEDVEAPGETDDGSAITSTDGTPLEFRFDAEVVASRDTTPKNAAIAQLEYLQGVLTTGARANAQFRFVDVTNVRERSEGAKKRINYSASVAVIYPAGARVPSTYKLAAPLDVTALGAFNEKYDGPCGRNEYGRETFWHDFNPAAPGCTLDADVHQMEARVRPHPLGTTDKYPEYDKIWADDSLDIVAVYGAISDTTDNDAGARDREAFLSKVERALTDATRTEEPRQPGILKHSVVTGKTRVAGQQRSVRLVAYFISEAASAGRAFMSSYAAETAKADFILYSGHSGLGKNIRALADATTPTRGKYQIAFFNGCQTFGYLGSQMHEARSELNGRASDPNGTKFLDVIVTALPAYAERLPTEQIMFDAMLEQTKGYGDLLRRFSGQQWTTHLTTVFGEDDNTFRP